MQYRGLNNSNRVLGYAYYKILRIKMIGDHQHSIGIRGLVKCRRGAWRVHAL